MIIAANVKIVNQMIMRLKSPASLYSGYWQLNANLMQLTGRNSIATARRSSISRKLQRINDAIKIQMPENAFDNFVNFSRALSKIDDRDDANRDL